MLEVNLSVVVLNKKKTNRIRIESVRGQLKCCFLNKKKTHRIRIESVRGSNKDGRDYSVCARVQFPVGVMRLYSACSSRKLFCRILRTCTRSPHSCTWMMPLSSWLRSFSDMAVCLRQCFLCRYRSPTAMAMPSAAERPSSKLSSDALCLGTCSGLSMPLSGTPDGSLACLGRLRTSPNRSDWCFLGWVREMAPSVGSRNGKKSERARRGAGEGSGWRDAVKNCVL